MKQEKFLVSPKTVFSQLLKGNYNLEYYTDNTYSTENNSVFHVYLGNDEHGDSNIKKHNNAVFEFLRQ